MEQIEKYNLAFIEVIEVTEDQLSSLTYQSVIGWDSGGHMQLMTKLEDVFDIALEMEDILDFSSYEKGKDVLSKYGIALKANNSAC